MVIQSSFYDPVLGLDTHLVGIPAPPAPVPVPTPIPIPFVGLVFDPAGLVVGAAMGMAMSGSPGVVLINSMPVTNCGTEVAGKLGVPHVPLPGVNFTKTMGPLYTSNDAELYFGANNTTLGGSLGVRLGDVALSCGDPVRLPTSIVMAVPKGMPVLNMNPMVPDLQAIAMAAAMKVLGALARAGARFFRRFRANSAFFQRLSRRLGGCQPPANASRWRTMYHRAVRTVTGHPVDVVTGNFFTEALDASLPGPIPLAIERVYESANSGTRRALGWGWGHSLDESFWLERGRAVVRLGDGREVEFPLWGLPGRRLLVGQHVDRVIHKMRLSCTAPGAYEILFWDRRLVHEYGPVPGGDPNVARLLRIRSLDRMHAIELFYDSRGVLEHVRDSGGRLLAFEHDASRRLVALKLPVAQGRGWYTHRRYVYDTLGNLVEVRDALGHAWRYAYKGRLMVQETDRTGLAFHFQYDGTGSLAKCVRTWGDGGIYDHEIHYDPKGRATVVEDSLGASTTYRYNERNQIVETTNPVGASSEYEDDPDTGARTKSVLPGRGSTEARYDAWGNLLELTNALGASVRLEYDANHMPVRVVDSRGREARASFDAFGRVVEQHSPAGQREAYEWKHGLLVGIEDARGELTRISYAANKSVDTITFPDGAIVEQTWDGLGRLIKSRDGRKVAARFEHDVEGRLVETHTRAGTIALQSFDAEGNLVESRDATRRIRFGHGHYHRLAWRDEDGARLRFEYDTEDRLTAVVNEAGERYTYARDVAGHVVGETGFDGLTRTHVNDLAGSPTLTLLPSGRTRERTYDTAGRLVAVVHSDGSFARFELDEFGTMLRAENESGPIELTHDADGNVLCETQGSFEVLASYGTRGERNAVRTSLGMDVSVVHDARGRTSRMKLGGGLGSGPAEIVFERDAAGHEVARRFGNGIDVEWTRDDAGRPTARKTFRRPSLAFGAFAAAATVAILATNPAHAFAGGADGRVEVDARAYRWRGEDQVAAIVDAATGPRFYDHDARGRLVRERRHDRTIERAMDVVGNVHRAGDGHDRSYSPGGRLERDHGFRYDYDADGNRIARHGPDGSTSHYRYNGHGLLAEVERPDGVRVQFEYDCFARRTTKRSVRFEDGGNGTERVEHEVRYVWHGQRVVHELDSARGRTDWFWDPETSTPIAKEHGGRRWTIVSDHLGTPTEMYDELGELAWKMQLDVFGVAQREAGRAEDCPWRWPGQYEDHETGLSYNRFRYFDPATGTYIAEDPIRLEGGLRLFGYVEAPDTESDPFGLNTALGTLGEVHARQMLEGRGYTHVGSVQNNSGHGIDLVMRNPQGELRIIEVKVNSAQLSPAQALGPQAFGISRANRATNGGPWWRNASAADRATAEIVENELDSAGRLRGFVVHVDIDAANNVTGARVRRWCN